MMVFAFFDAAAGEFVVGSFPGVEEEYLCGAVCGDEADGLAGGVVGGFGVDADDLGRVLGRRLGEGWVAGVGMGARVVRERNGVLPDTLSSGTSIDFTLILIDEAMQELLG